MPGRSPRHGGTGTRCRLSQLPWRCRCRSCRCCPVVPEPIVAMWWKRRCRYIRTDWDSVPQPTVATCRDRDGVSQPSRCVGTDCYHGNAPTTRRPSGRDLGVVPQAGGAELRLREAGLDRVVSPLSLVLTLVPCAHPCPLCCPPCTDLLKVPLHEHDTSDPPSLGFVRDSPVLATPPVLCPALSSPAPSLPRPSAPLLLPRPIPPDPAPKPRPLVVAPPLHVAVGSLHPQTWVPPSQSSRSPLPSPSPESQPFRPGKKRSRLLGYRGCSPTHWGASSSPQGTAGWWGGCSSTAPTQPNNNNKKLLWS